MLLYVDANFASPYALVAFVSLLEKGVNFDMEAVRSGRTMPNREAGFAKTSITRAGPDPRS